jgi:hypothetical protein
MGEIKSTLEIAMEKAKALEISSEDKRRFKQEEILTKARDLSQRYIERPNRSKRLTDVIEEIGEDANLLREALVETFLGALDLSRPSERIWEGLEEMGLKDPGSFRETLTRIAKEAELALGQEKEKAKKTIRESLAGSGISGTAIEPHVEDSPLLKDSMKRLDEKVSGKLGKLRQEITAAIEKRSSSPR